MGSVLVGVVDSKVAFVDFLLNGVLHYHMGDCSFSCLSNSVDSVDCLHLSPLIEAGIEQKQVVGSGEREPHGAGAQGEEEDRDGGVRLELREVVALLRHRHLAGQLRELDPLFVQLRFELFEKWSPLREDNDFC